MQVSQILHSRTRTKRNAMAAALGVAFGDLAAEMWRLRRPAPLGEGMTLEQIGHRLEFGDKADRTPGGEHTAKSTLSDFFNEVPDPGPDRVAKRFAARSRRSAAVPAA